MNKVKIFKTDDLDSVALEKFEKDINYFLSHKAPNVISIEYTSNKYYFSALIHYRL